MNCNWECKKTEVNWMRWNVNFGHTKRAERERERVVSKQDINQFNVKLLNAIQLWHSRETNQYFVDDDEDMLYCSIFVTNLYCKLHIVDFSGLYVSFDRFESNGKRNKFIKLFCCSLFMTFNTLLVLLDLFIRLRLLFSRLY